MSIGLAGCAKEVELELLFVGVNADNDELLVFMMLLELLDELFELMLIGLDAAPIPVVFSDNVVFELDGNIEAGMPPPPPLRLKRSLFMFDKNPLPAAENNPDPPVMTPAPVAPVDNNELTLVSTLGADVFKPNIGVGSAGFINRSLARRF